MVQTDPRIKEDTPQRRLKLAEDPKTSFEDLLRIFFDASIKLVQNEKPQLFDAIVKNPQFQSDDEEVRQIIKEFSTKAMKQIENRIEKLTKT